MDEEGDKSTHKLKGVKKRKGCSFGSAEGSRVWMHEGYGSVDQEGDDLDHHTLLKAGFSCCCSP